MPMLRSIVGGLRSLFRKEQVSQELDDELNSFLDMAAEEKMKQGMSRKEALRAVRLERGNLEVTKEAVRTAGWESLVESCWRDLRFAARVLRKSPGFTAASVLTLALGVIGTTLVFTAYDALVLRTLVVRDSKSLAVLKRELRKGGASTAFSEPEYRNLSEHNHVFDGAIAEKGYDTVLAQLPGTDQKKLVEQQQVVIK